MYCIVRELEIINRCIIVSGESGAGNVLYGESQGRSTSVSLLVERAVQARFCIVREPGKRCYRKDARIGTCLRLEVTGVPDPFQYHRLSAYMDGLKFSFFPRTMQLGMDLQPKLSLLRQLIGLSPKYNDLGLGTVMAWYACP